MLVGIAGGMDNGVLLPLLSLVFGGVLNGFTDRTFDLYTLNLTLIAFEYCPPDYHLTPANIYDALS